jgi:hypothetical protein
VKRLEKSAALFEKVAQQFMITENIRGILLKVIAGIIGRNQISTTIQEKTFLSQIERELKGILGSGQIDAQGYRSMVMRILANKSIDPVWKLKNISQPIYLIWNQLR